LRAFPFTFARESADFTQARASGQTSQPGNSRGHAQHLVTGLIMTASAARSAVGRGGVRDGSPEGRDRAAG